MLSHFYCRALRDYMRAENSIEINPGRTWKWICTVLDPTHTHTHIDGDGRMWVE